MILTIDTTTSTHPHRNLFGNYLEILLRRLTFLNSRKQRNHKNREETTPRGKRNHNLGPKYPPLSFLPSKNRRNVRNQDKWNYPSIIK